MDSADFENLKTEKLISSMNYYNRFRTITKLFHLFFVFWIVTRVPSAVDISIYFLRRISAVTVSPVFVFVASNAIIVAIIVKSKNATAESSHGDADLYDRLIKIGVGEIGARALPPDSPPLEEKQIIVSEDKSLICIASRNDISKLNLKIGISENNLSLKSCSRESDQSDSYSDSDPDPQIGYDDVKTYRKSVSANFGRKMAVELQTRKLRRSKTEKICGSDDGMTAIKLFPEDDLSNEEFNKTIEEFISKQSMFRLHDDDSVTAISG